MTDGVHYQEGTESTQLHGGRENTVTSRDNNKTVTDCYSVTVTVTDEYVLRVSMDN